MSAFSGDLLLLLYSFDLGNICFTYSKIKLSLKGKKQSPKIKNKLKRMNLTIYQVGGKTTQRNELFQITLEHSIFTV